LHQSGIAASISARRNLKQEQTMLTNKIKNALKIAFNEIIESGGQIGSRREFYIINLSQTVFETEDEARAFVNQNERELNKFFATLDPNYSE
jgi:hypothetical protein